MVEKLSLDYIESLITEEKYSIDPPVIVCTLSIGEADVVGVSYCFNKASFDMECSKAVARNDAIKKLFDLEAYHQKRLRPKQ